ncbi:MAG: hypothetical protein R3191_07710, partial [Anaerolineales bacterium]|nr:hypothetical protein [Anaerolineales bacterium]
MSLKPRLWFALLALSLLLAGCGPARGGDVTVTFPYTLVPTVSDLETRTPRPVITTATARIPATVTPPAWTSTPEPSRTPTASPTPPSFPMLLSEPDQSIRGFGNEGDPDGRIAFVTLADASSHIFTVAEGGTDRRQVTSGPNYDTYPTWSHDGRRIAYLRAAERHPVRAIPSHLLLTDPDGANTVNLTPSLDRALSSLTWAPDDRVLAFAGESVGNDIYILDVGSQDLLQVTDAASSPVGCRDPSWSPDGAHLVFTCRGGMVSHLVLANRDGSGLFGVDFLGQVDRALWLPSGDLIAYTGGMSCALGTLDADFMLARGNAEYEPRPCLNEVFQTFGYDPMPIYAVEWSPANDSRLALQSPDLLQVIDHEDGQIVRVAGDFEGVEGQLSWTSDESKIAFVYHDGSDYEIAVLNLRSNEISQLTNNRTD